MSKSFRTKFNMTPAVWPSYNPVDAVDRLTYVDTTQQITRMLNAGASMRMRNSQGLKGEDFNAPAMPVYAPDISQSTRMIKEYKEALKENAERKTAELKAKIGIKADPTADSHPEKGDD